LSTEDLTGDPAGQDGVWSCVEVPTEEISRQGSRVVNYLDRFFPELLG
jgi:hypothetical protein